MAADQSTQVQSPSRSQHFSPGAAESHGHQRGTDHTKRKNRHKITPSNAKTCAEHSEKHSIQMARVQTHKRHPVHSHHAYPSHSTGHFLVGLVLGAQILDALHALLPLGCSSIFLFLPLHWLGNEALLLVLVHVLLTSVCCCLGTFACCWLCFSSACCWLCSSLPAVGRAPLFLLWFLLCLPAPLCGSLPLRGGLWRLQLHYVAVRHRWFAAGAVGPGSDSYNKSVCWLCSSCPRQLRSGLWILLSSMC